MSGYIGRLPLTEAIQTRKSFKATSGGQTTFSMAYQPGYIDVYLNGVRIREGASEDYIASNGTSIVLNSGVVINTELDVVSLTSASIVDKLPTQSAATDGKVLTSDGTIASWDTDANTTYSVGDGGLTEKNFTTALNTKLTNIETAADVTDATNVTAAGALMDSELAGLAAVKATTGTFLTADQTKLDGIATSANLYVHPSSAGDKHIPTGGASGQFLKYSSSGTAVWAADNDTTYSVGDAGLTQKNFTTTLKTKLDGIETSADVTDATNVTAAGALMDSELAGLAAVKATTGTFLTADQTKLDGIAASANLYVHPTSAGDKHIPTAGASGQFLKYSSSGTAVWAADNDTVYTHPSNHAISVITGLQTALDTKTTPGYVDTAIANLVDSAPATLDTLKELATALGDDANHVTTMTTLVGTKLSLAGGAMTGAITTNSTFDGVDIAVRDAILTSTTTTAGAALPKAGGAMTGAITTNSTFDGVDIAVRDAILTSTTTTANAALPKAGGTMTGTTAHGDNVKATYGASADLKIYHDGSNSYVYENGTGDLRLRSNGASVSIQSDGGENLIVGTKDGEAKLYHNNLEKLATTSTGVTVTGTVAATSFTGDGGSLTGIDALPTQTGNAGKYLTTDASTASWATLDTDANTTTKGLYEHAHTISANYSITSGNNALTAGPITINAGYSVTVPTGSIWTIV